MVCGPPILRSACHSAIRAYLPASSRRQLAQLDKSHPLPPAKRPIGAPTGRDQREITVYQWLCSTGPAHWMRSGEALDLPEISGTRARHGDAMTSPLPAETRPWNARADGRTMPWFRSGSADPPHPRSTTGRVGGKGRGRRRGPARGGTCLLPDAAGAADAAAQLSRDISFIGSIDSIVVRRSPPDAVARRWASGAIILAIGGPVRGASGTRRAHLPEEARALTTTADGVEVRARLVACPAAQFPRCRSAPFEVRPAIRLMRLTRLTGLMWLTGPTCPTSPT